MKKTSMLKLRLTKLTIRELTLKNLALAGAGPQGTLNGRPTNTVVASLHVDGTGACK